MRSRSRSRTSLAAGLIALLAAGPASAVISAPEGSQYLYLTTGPEEAHGGGDTGSDLNGDGFDEGDLSSVEIGFEATSDATLRFDWDVLTSEVTGGVSDFFRVLLDGSEILSESILTPDDTPLPPPGLSGFSGGILVGPDGSYFYDGRLGWGTFSTSVLTGNHTLQFSVYDDEDLYVDTALLVDGLALDGVVFQGF
jgi:hypothetical protein